MASINNLTVTNNNGNIMITDKSFAKHTECVAQVLPISKGIYTFIETLHAAEQENAAYDGKPTHGTFNSKEEAAEAAFNFVVNMVSNIETDFAAGYPAAAAQKATLLKTKYTRRRNGKPESFVSYELSMLNGTAQTTVTFPKGVTLPQIKKLYPQLDITVVVMPSIALKGLTQAACEYLKEPIITGDYGGKKPANIAIEAATAEELEADLTTEPENTIYTIESERPAKAVQPEAEAKAQEAIHENSDHARRIAGETPATAHARYELSDVKDWATLQEWIAANPKHCLARKKDNAKSVSFHEYNDGVVCIVLDNEKEAYPYYRVLPRYFDVVPM